MPALWSDVEDRGLPDGVLAEYKQDA